MLGYFILSSVTISAVFALAWDMSDALNFIVKIFMVVQCIIGIICAVKFL